MSFLFYNIEYFSNDDNTRHINKVILRMTRIEVDVKIEFKSDVSEGASITQFFISESCKSVFNKSNRINVFSNSYGNDNGSRPRSSGSQPIIIGIPNSAPTSTPGENFDSPTTSTNV